jgi:hypothetical protein
VTNLGSMYHQAAQLGSPGAVKLDPQLSERLATTA